MKIVKVIFVNTAGDSKEFETTSEKMEELILNEIEKMHPHFEKFHLTVKRNSPAVETREIYLGEYFYGTILIIYKLF